MTFFNGNLSIGLVRKDSTSLIVWEKKFELDVEYVEHVRFSEDWKIILKTIFAVLKREGISSDTSVTMEEFHGSKG